MLTRFLVVILSHYIHIWNHLAHLKLIWCYTSIIKLKKKKTCWQVGRKKKSIVPGIFRGTSSHFPDGPAIGMSLNCPDTSYTLGMYWDVWSVFPLHGTVLNQCALWVLGTAFLSHSITSKPALLACHHQCHNPHPPTSGPQLLSWSGLGN